MKAPRDEAMARKDSTGKDSTAPRASRDERQESEKYRRNIDELNRSRDIDIDRALMLRAR
jgi:hypothetical protein